LAALLSTSCWSLAEANSPLTEDEIKINAIKNLNGAARWSIENGIMKYYRHDKDKMWIQEKTSDEWAVSIYSSPIIDSDQFMARFVIKTVGIYYELLAMERLDYNNSVYEYWVQKISGSELSSKIDWHCTFIVTRADDVRGKREILKEETQFFEPYQIDTSKILEFPVDDVESLFDLSAWLYPDSYKNSDLKNYKVIETKSGEYVKKKVIWFERMFLQ
jgi:hypothetical protein